jgi:microcystin-dependent protein
MPPHRHVLRANSGPASTTTSDDNSALARSVGGFSYAPGDSDIVPLADGSIGESGNPGDGLAHNNMQPFLAMNFIIALAGLYPSRS